MDIIKRIEDVCYKVCYNEEHTSEQYVIIKLYKELFGTFCNKYLYYYDESGKTLFYTVNGLRDMSNITVTYKSELGIDLLETLKNFEPKILYSFPLVCSYDNYRAYIGENFIIFEKSALIAFGEINPDTNENFHTLSNAFEIYSSEPPETFLPMIPAFKGYPKPSSYRYVSIDKSGDFDYSTFEIQNNSDVSLNNYNEDLPYDALLNFCNDESDCGLTLLYGAPGTGKTTLLKKLITNSKSTFYMLDASLLSNITSGNFIDFLGEYCQKSVFILEDCEKLLMDRNKNYNPWIGTLLNLTDGMLGEGLNIRFICTFNANLKDIDSALMRPGRLKVCYEFKGLTKDRLDSLSKELCKDLSGKSTLAEIYSEDYINSSNINRPNKIGF